MLNNTDKKNNYTVDYNYQVQLSNIASDTDIVKDIFKNRTQYVNPNYNIGDLNQVKTDKVTVQLTQNQKKILKILNEDKTVNRRLLGIDQLNAQLKILNVDKTVNRRMLEMDQSDAQQDSNTETGVQITCKNNGFINVKVLQFQDTNTIIGIKAVASNDTTWNWDGKMNSNEFLIPMASVSVVDILYTNNIENKTKALRVHVPWMPLSSTGTCKNFTDSSEEGMLFAGKWQGARIGVTSMNGERNKVLQVEPDIGMRITRIVSIETISVRAMQLLSGAKTRDEVINVCMQFQDSCIQLEHNTLSNTRSWMSWQHASLENSLHSQKSILWVVDVKRSGDCEVSVGSWLLASMALKDPNKMSTLFTENVDRVCQFPQPIILIKPGFAWPNLKANNVRNTWSITFVELQNVNFEGKIPDERNI